ncbi:flagellar biosynthesis protein FlhB [Symbiobacterium thermophilum]|uniref:Flagellar biosynthetic protein FlhB n=1 Tax=Symbiobacterium thermophilum (strain DSM 24528 / JCM 14929 / IAM 14863 / T) TaxID=292459 RepID=Q67K27_SYMTH|nr:flagellar biosynthesis protein FlhB [Symbiobacterium thermophilum]BAD41971.1 flagellar biosynthesis protein [Symbiobacterium thermophilum IAM 14863]
MDLQLFAERTEEPTPRRLQKAREEGRVARSTDLVAGLGLVAATLALRGLGGYSVQQVTGGMVGAFETLRPLELTPETTAAVMQDWALIGLRAVLPIALVVVAIGVVAGTLQTRFIFTLRALVPRFATLNPITGLTRIFSLRTVTELVKGLIKLAAIGYIAYRSVRGLVPQFPNLIAQTVPAGLSAIADMVLDVMLAVGLAYLVVGVLDYGYQYWEFRRSMRMTKQEVKQEHREQEGAPELKSRQRQRMRELAMRRRALKEVPGADVVVTNPTHFAVALKYEAAKDEAPRVVAKGADLLALEIQKIARAHDVPLVENRTLARGLYYDVEVGRLIPPEYYQAVAEVLAFVYNLRRQSRQAGQE